MNNDYSTSRLTLKKISETDAYFILELVNSAGWIEFIGDRHVHSVEDAVAYIKKIKENKNINNWTVSLKDQQTPIGII